MESSISVMLAGQVALRRRLDVVANNLANADTTGFKLESQVLETERRPRGEDRVIYPLDRGSFTDLHAGPITATGNPLDVAIVGDGYLAVATANGQRFTRDGRLTRAADGTLTSVSGEPVLGAGGERITIPSEARSVVISSDGTVTADSQELGQIGLFRQSREAGEVRGADNDLLPEATPVAFTEGRLQQGALEASNVQPIHEIVDLIELHRSYQRSQDLLDGEDERIRKLVDNVVGA